MPGYTRRLRLLASGDRRTTFRGPFDPSMKDDVYRGLDVLVIPSRAQETFSFVAREALLRGVPVIAAQVGALPEVVAHSSNGWLFAESDANQLASLLTEICDHPGKLRGLELPGRFEILTVRQHAARLRSVYASLVA